MQIRDSAPLDSVESSHACGIPWAPAGAGRRPPATAAAKTRDRIADIVLDCIITPFWTGHESSARRRYSSSAKTKSDSPETIETYCLVPTLKLIGPLLIDAPRFVFHSSAPVRASSAWK